MAFPIRPAAYDSREFNSTFVLNLALTVCGRCRLVDSLAWQIPSSSSISRSNPENLENRRRMEAYKQAFGAGGSTMVLSPDTDFFRYFNAPAGQPPAPAK